MQGMELALVTVVMPVYNRLEYLDEAVQSVFAQTRPTWRLMLADDRSEEATWQREQEYARDARVVLERQERNVGLFANLNAALRKVETPYVLLLCTDDRLKPEAIERLLGTAQSLAADLVLPSFDAIDSQGRASASSHGEGRRAMTASTRALERREALELLLHYASINGNLTGMFFSREFYDRVGPFRTDWRQAADWEWLHRAARAGTIALATESLAFVRDHEGQLSNANLRTGHRVTEVAYVLRSLLSDPELADHPRARSWARHHMQHYVLEAARALLRGDIGGARHIVHEIRSTTGVLPTLGTFVARLPGRLARLARRAGAGRW